MKNWQKTRNYRRMKDENGNVIANVITVFGEKIEVSDELFTMYAHMDAHERYIMEEAPRGRVFSLDKMVEDGMSVEAVSHQFALSAEEILIAREDEQDTQHKLELLKQALSQLDEADRALIKAVYFENISMREYARRICVSQHDCQTPQSYFAHAEKIFREFLILRVFTGHFFLEYSVEKIFSLSLVDFSLCSPPREW